MHKDVIIKKFFDDQQEIWDKIKNINSRTRTSGSRSRSRSRSPDSASHLRRRRSYSSYSSRSGSYSSSRENRSPAPTAPTRGRNSSRSPLPSLPTSSHHHSYNASRRQRRSSLSPVLSTKIMVNKLTKNVKEAHLQEIFGAFGRILRIEVFIDEKWQTNKGTAYINFETRSDAERAISYMDGGQLDGNMLSCTFVPRQPSPPPIRRRPIMRYNSPPPFRQFTASSYRGRGRSPQRRYSRSRSPPVRRRRSYSYSSYSSRSSQSSSSRSHSRSYSSKSRSHTHSPRSANHHRH